MEQIRFSVVRTSRGRFWHGFDATLYDATPGFDETLAVSHSVSMHVGAPAFVRSQCDGGVVHRLQTPGDLKIIPAGYARLWEIERPARKITINVSQSLVESAAEAMEVNAGGIAITPRLHVRDPQIEHIAWAVKNELESTEPLGRVYAESLGLALASHLVRRYRRVRPRPVTGGLSKRRLDRVMEYIADHLCGDLSLAQLANVANVSPSHFNVLFKQTLGVSVHQYVIRKRVEHATQLLLDDSFSLSEVALQAGFANQAHMAASMRRIARVTPGSLRRNAM